MDDQAQPQQRPPPAHQGSTVRRALLVVLLAVLAFVWLAHLITTPQVAALDAEMVRRAAALRTPLLNVVLLGATRLGNPQVIAGLLAVLGLVLLRLRRKLELLSVALAGAGAWFLTEVLKQYYQRPRPALVPTLLETGSYSFPSAHALGALVGYGMLLFIGLRLARRRWQCWLLLLALPAATVLIGASRIYAGVHFPTDVLAGFLVGTAWLLLSAALVWAAEHTPASRTAD